ncbi:MAG: hypothetical protein ACOCM2_03090, partial [Bacteroidales bacterium]
LSALIIFITNFVTKTFFRIGKNIREEGKNILPTVKNGSYQMARFARDSETDRRESSDRTNATAPHGLVPAALLRFC